jgi:hypothetical protein
MDQIATELIDILTAPTRRSADAPDADRTPARSSTERLLQPELVIRGSSAPG